MATPKTKAQKKNQKAETPAPEQKQRTFREKMQKRKFRSAPAGKRSPGEFLINRGPMTVISSSVKELKNKNGQEYLVAQVYIPGKSSPLAISAHDAAAIDALRKHVRAVDIYEKELATLSDKEKETFKPRPTLDNLLHVGNRNIVGKDGATQHKFFFNLTDHKASHGYGGSEIRHSMVQKENKETGEVFEMPVAEALISAPVAHSGFNKVSNADGTVSYNIVMFPSGVPMNLSFTEAEYNDPDSAIKGMFDRAFEEKKGTVVTAVVETFPTWDESEETKMHFGNRFVITDICAIYEQFGTKDEQTEEAEESQQVSNAPGM